MFDSLLPDQNNTWNTSFNQPFTNSGLNLESTSEMLPPPPRTNSAFSQPEIDLKNLTCRGDENLFISHFSVDSQRTQALNPGSYNSTSSAEKSAVDPLTGEVLSNDIVEQALQSAQGYLKGFATDPDFNAKMNLAFGNNWNAEVASKLVQDFANGNFSELPAIEILPSAALNNQANGAFASATNTIYLSQEFIAQNAGNPEAITSVLLEETGHYIDSKINVSDAAGDEGDIFSRLAQGKTIGVDELLGLKAEDDSAVLKLNGQIFWIEQSTTISQVTFRTVEKNKYVVAEGGGGSTVNANRDVAGLWENFTLIDLNGGSLNNGDVVNIRSQNGMYVVAEGSGGGVVNANRTVAGPWEEFQVIKVNGNGKIRSGDSLALRAKNGQYVVAERGGGANVNANRNAIGPWENFIISFPNPLHSNPTESNPLREFRHPLGRSEETPIRWNHSDSYGQKYAVDFSQPPIGIGTPVYAMRSGTVVNWRDTTADKNPNLTSIDDGRQGTTANFLVVKLDDNDAVDDGYRAMYLHIQQGSIPTKFKQAGARVETGEYIGNVGYNGVSQGVHLHVEVNQLTGNKTNMWQRKTFPFQWK